jgi:hypothetical protein
MTVSPPPLSSSTKSTPIRLARTCGCSSESSATSPSRSERTALINGRAQPEGEVAEHSPEQPPLRARRLGVDLVEHESGGGETVILRLDDPSALNRPPKPAVANARGNSNGNNSGGSGTGGRSSVFGDPHRH